MLHQIWFDLGAGASPPLPNGTATMRRCAERSGVEYKLWSEEEALALLSTMPARLQEVWKGLPHAINRLDFFRYMLMYRLGGMYFDVDFRCIRSLTDFMVDDTVFLCEEWPFSFSSGSLHNGALICKSSGHPFWERVFDAIEERLGRLRAGDALDMGRSVFGLTGTGMLRDVAWAHLAATTPSPKVVVMPFGVFCPLMRDDGAYLDSYDLEPQWLIASRLHLPSQEDVTRCARSFTAAFLAPADKIWQQTFKR